MSATAAEATTGFDFGADNVLAGLPAAGPPTRLTTLDLAPDAPPTWVIWLGLAPDALPHMARLAPDAPPTWVTFLALAPDAPPTWVTPSTSLPTLYPRGYTPAASHRRSIPRGSHLSRPRAPTDPTRHTARWCAATFVVVGCQVVETPSEAPFGGGGDHDPDGLIVSCVAYFRAQRCGSSTSKVACRSDRFRDAEGAPTVPSSTRAASSFEQAFRTLRSLGFPEGVAPPWRTSAARSVRRTSARSRYFERHPPR